jgi:hypothetical protein
LLLIGLAILGEQFHRSREPALIFSEDIGGRVGIAETAGPLLSVRNTDSPTPLQLCLRDGQFSCSIDGTAFLISARGTWVQSVNTGAGCVFLDNQF